MAKTTNILDLNNRLEKVEKEKVAQNSYTSLKNKPKINNVTLTGNKSLVDIGAAADADLTTLAGNVGDIAQLTTTDKSSTVAAINEINSSSFGTVTIDPTYAVTGSDWEIERLGKLRILMIKHLQSIPSGDTNIGSVSSQDIPHNVAQIKVWGSTTDSHYNVSVGTNGTIFIHNYSQTPTASEVLTAELVYVV